MAREPRWISRVVGESIHYDQIAEHGGLKGIRDEAALDATLAGPQNKWHYKPDIDLEALAAAYAFGIAQNHPFHDGNKRVAFVTMVVFLELNGHRFTTNEASVVRTIMGLAAGDISERRLATWIRKNTTDYATDAAANAPSVNPLLLKKMFGIPTGQCPMKSTAI